MQITFLIIYFSYGLSCASAYDWQRHVPEHAKQCVPGTDSACREATTFDVNAVSGVIAMSTHYGPLTLCKAEVNSTLTVFGPLLARESNFKGDLICHGPVTLNGSKNTIQGLVKIIGPLNANSEIFEESVLIFGYLRAKNCNFKKPITIHTSKVDLENTEIDNMIIDDSEGNPVKVFLENVQINGKITTSSGKGMLYLKNCKISREKIIGCKIIVVK